MGLGLGLGLWLGNQPTNGGGGGGAPANATFNPTTGVNKHSNVLLSNGNLTATMPAGVGSWQYVRTTPAGRTGARQFEVNLDTPSGQPSYIVGVDDGTSDFSVAYSNGGPGLADSKGVTFFAPGNGSFYICAKGGVDNSGTLSATVSGDKVTAQYDTAAGTVKFLYNGAQIGTTVTGISLGAYYGNVGGQSLSGASPIYTANFAGPFTYGSNSAY